MQKTDWSNADYVGGHAALDFLNTVADTGKSRQRDKIPDWPSMVGWAVGAGLLSRREAAIHSHAMGLDTNNALDDLHTLRADGYAFMLAFTQGRCSPNEEWARLQVALRNAMARAQLIDAGVAFTWRADKDHAHYLIDALALSFEQLLRSPDLARVRQCGRCTWFFLNRGRGVGRRWCDMRTCGNRAKAEAFRNQC